MRHGRDLTWSQVLLAANTPMLLKAAMVDGRRDLGVMASGQVAGVIEDLPSCAELVEGLMSQAETVLQGLQGPQGPQENRDLRDLRGLSAHTGRARSGARPADDRDAERP